MYEENGGDGDDADHSGVVLDAAVPDALAVLVPIRPPRPGRQRPLSPTERHAGGGEPRTTFAKRRFRALFWFCLIRHTLREGPVGTGSSQSQHPEYARHTTNSTAFVIATAADKIVPKVAGPRAI